jgi:hypothetical protein
LDTPASSLYSGTDVGPEEKRLLALFTVDCGLGAERAVWYLYSLSLKSASAKSSASSELALSKPANRLLTRWGLRRDPLSFVKGPSSLFPGYAS